MKAKARAERGVPGVPVAGTAPRTLAIAHDMYYVWHAARWLLLLPVSMADNGTMHFSWRSSWARYTILGWAVFTPTVIASAATLYLLNMERGVRNLQELAQQITAFMIGMYTIALPFTMFATIQMYPKLLAGWERMEMMYTAMTGVPLVLGMKWLDYLATLGLIHAIVTAVALWYQLRLPLWILPPIVQSAYAMFFLGILWICIYAMFRALGANLARRLVADVEVMGAAGVRMHRLLWLHVVKLLQSYSDRNSKVQLPHFMSLFAMCVAYFFSFVYTVLGHLQELLSLDSLTWHDLGPGLVLNGVLYCTSGGGILLMCMASQEAINQIFFRPRKDLLRISISGVSEAVRTEVVYFLEDIDIRKPVVSLKGLLFLNRSTLVSCVVICTTYIVVLSQFAVQLNG